MGLAGDRAPASHLEVRSVPVARTLATADDGPNPVEEFG